MGQLFQSKLCSPPCSPLDWAVKSQHLCLWPGSLLPLVSLTSSPGATAQTWHSVLMDLNKHHSRCFCNNLQKSARPAWSSLFSIFKCVQQHHGTLPTRSAGGRGRAAASASEKGSPQACRGRTSLDRLPPLQGSKRDMGSRALSRPHGPAPAPALLPPPEVCDSCRGLGAQQLMFEHRDSRPLMVQTLCCEF